MAETKAKKVATGAQATINDALRAVVSKATERAIARAAAEIGELCREEVVQALAEALPGAVAALIAATRTQPVPLPYPARAQQAPAGVPAEAPAEPEAEKLPGFVEIDGKKVPVAVKGKPARKGEFNIGRNGGVPTVRGAVMDGIMPFRGNGRD